MGLEKALRRLDGVESFAMLMRTGTVTLGVHPGTSLSTEVLKDAVDSAGLTLDGVTPPQAAAAGE